MGVQHMRNMPNKVSSYRVQHECNVYVAIMHLHACNESRIIWKASQQRSIDGHALKRSNWKTTTANKQSLRGHSASRQIKFSVDKTMYTQHREMSEWIRWFVCLRACGDAERLCVMFFHSLFIAAFLSLTFSLLSQYSHVFIIGFSVCVSLSFRCPIQKALSSVNVRWFNLCVLFFISVRVSMSMSEWVNECLRFLFIYIFYTTISTYSIYGAVCYVSNGCQFSVWLAYLHHFDR